MGGPPLLPVPMQNAAFTAPMPMPTMPVAGMPPLGMQSIVAPGAAWPHGQLAPSLNGQQPPGQPQQHTPPQAVPSAHSVQGKTKRKTQLCSHFTTGGACRFGERCSFAHGTAELRSVCV